MEGASSQDTSDSDQSIYRELDISSSSSEDREETKTNGTNGITNGNANGITNGFGMFEAGIIEQVYVQDFMCHKKLTVNFGRHVNFITGANGSGKSAIVAAIQLCLGSSAKRTGRGTNLASLIRDGAQSGAVLRVKLINEGDEAFQPHVYGNRITVERRIPKSGQAGYALLNSANKTVSTEKAELDRLLAHFNVAVENPCCVLTQDEAKRFIQGKEADKYAFFLKATLLERTKEEIAEAEANLQKAREDQRRNINQIQLKEQTVKQLEQEAEELEAVEKLGFQIAKLTVDIAWATAKEQQALCEAIEAKIPKRQETCNELQQKLAEIQNELENTGGLDEEEQQRIQAQINQIMDELVTTQAAARTADAEVTNMENALRRQDQAIKRQERRRNELRAELQQKQARATSGANSDVQRKEHELEKLDTSIKGLQHDIAEAEARFKHAREQQAEAQGRCEALNRQLQGIQRSIRDGNSEIRRLQSMKTRAGAFGRFAEEIARRVDQHRGMFTGPVLGPVGLFVQLKEEHRDAALAVERVIGRNLGSFVVTNDRDSHQLQRLIRDVNRDAAREHSIAVQPAGDRYAVPPIDGAVTVADAISVDENLIFNMLVDQAQIERVIITETEQECERTWITVDRRMERFTHPNISQAVAKDGTLIVIRNGNRSSQSNTNRNQRLGVDVNDQVEVMHQQLQEEQRRAKEVQDALDEASSIQRQLDQEARQLRASIDQMRASLRSQGNKMQQVSQELEQLRAELDADLSPFHTEIDALTEEIGQMQEKYNELLPELETLRLTAKKKHDVVKEVMQRKKALDAELAKLQAEAEACIASRTTLLAKRDKVERDLAKAQRKLDEVATVLEEQRQELQRALAYARQQASGTLGDDWDGQDCHDRIEKSTEELQREQKALITTKQREEQRARGRNVNITQIRERLNTARAEWLATRDLIENVSAMLRDMTDDIAERKRRWTDQLAHVSRIVEAAFDNYMQRKGFSGNVEFDHENSKLSIRARTDNTDELSQIDDIRQLSGGERSFTTLSLLLALGHVIDCPFRVMDEYDVFLDQIARSITIHQLIEYAQDPLQEGRQFIVITPQDLTAVQTNPERVKIVKMATPER